MIYQLCLELRCMCDLEKASQTVGSLANYMRNFVLREILSSEIFGLQGNFCLEGNFDF